MTGVEVEMTGTVEILNVAVADPAGTVTVCGTVALRLLDARLMATPPVGALPVNVTVPVEATPPTTVVGEADKADSVGANTFRTA
jgi:hypothetical protein